MKIYISGKMRGLPEEESRRRFEAARQYLIELGHDVVNPWDSEKEKEAKCLEWEDYILYDLRIIKHCDALFMLDNWQDSDGAKCEHAFAKGRGMAILYEKQWPYNNDLDVAAKEYAKSNCGDPDTRYFYEVAFKTGANTVLQEIDNIICDSVTWGEAVDRIEKRILELRRKLL